MNVYCELKTKRGLKLRPLLPSLHGLCPLLCVTVVTLGVQSTVDGLVQVKLTDSVECSPLVPENLGPQSQPKCLRTPGPKLVYPPPHPSMHPSIHGSKLPTRLQMCWNQNFTYLLYLIKSQHH